MLSYVRRLGRRSSPICISAFAFSLTNLTGLAAQPVQPPALPAAAPAQVAAPAPPAAVPVAETPKPAPVEPAKPAGAEALQPAVAEATRPAAIPSPPPAAPAANPAPATAAAPEKTPPPAAPAASAPADNLERLRKAAGLLVEANTALGAPRSPYGELIYDIALRHAVNPHLVAAMIHVESAFNPRAVSRKGACGLMQLLPETARRFGLSSKKDLFDPVKNLEAGVRYLKWLTIRFGGDVQKILAAYNAGEGAVARFGGIPPYRETQRYVQKIFNLLGLAPTPAPPPSPNAAPAADLQDGVPAGL
ncbi:MAG TPA: lytic transglycosylase domain-containing protein [Thermoanaerobaculia bacterium]|jgi:soluble lytic murein transglycosylase-like protein